MSPTNLSASRTINPSPLGNHATTLASSFRSISINLRGKGLECPVLLEPPGLLVADKAGDTDAPRPELRRPELPELLVVAGDEDKLAAPGLRDKPGWTLMTPAAMPPLTGIKMAAGGVPACGC